MSLTPEQNRLFKHWHNVSRWVFNQALNFMIVYETDEVKKIGSAKRIKLLNGQWINRDIIGARNVLLCALVDQPHKVTWQLGNVSDPSIP